MKQVGVVRRILKHGTAEVEVERGTACGHCSGCGECIYGKQLIVEAENVIYAEPGARVVLESETGVIMKVTMLVYALPLVFFFLGYGIAAAFGWGQGQCIAASGVGLLIGGVLVYLLGRRHKKIDYRITGYSN